jgi:hypothetical protein
MGLFSTPTKSKDRPMSGVDDYRWKGGNKKGRVISNPAL